MQKTGHLNETYAMGRICQHFQALYGIWLERTVEHKEAYECERALDVFTSHLVDLRKIRS
jgi:hypothetical protein